MLHVIVQKKYVTHALSNFIHAFCNIPSSFYTFYPLHHPLHTHTRAQTHTHKHADIRRSVRARSYAYDYLRFVCELL